MSGRGNGREDKGGAQVFGLSNWKGYEWTRTQKLALGSDRGACVCMIQSKSFR